MNGIKSFALSNSPSTEFFLQIRIYQNTYVLGFFLQIRIYQESTVRFSTRKGSCLAGFPGIPQNIICCHYQAFAVLRTYHLQNIEQDMGKKKYKMIHVPKNVFNSTGQHSVGKHLMKCLPTHSSYSSSHAFRKSGYNVLESLESQIGTLSLSSELRSCKQNPRKAA